MSIRAQTCPTAGTIVVEDMTAPSDGVASGVIKVGTSSVVSPDQKFTSLPGRQQIESTTRNSHKSVDTRGAPGQTNAGAVASPCLRELSRYRVSMYLSQYLQKR